MYAIDHYHYGYTWPLSSTIEGTVCTAWEVYSAGQMGLDINFGWALFLRFGRLL